MITKRLSESNTDLVSLLLSSNGQKDINNAPVLINLPEMNPEVVSLALSSASTPLPLVPSTSNDWKDEKGWITRKKEARRKGQKEADER